MKKPCRVCGIPASGPTCREHKPKRPSRQSRGYDSEYDRNARVITGGSAGARAGGRACVVCGREILPGELVTVEHITPLRHGGSNDPSNLGAAHERCNYGWRKGLH